METLEKTAVRKVERVLPATRVQEGEGFWVQRPFPSPALSYFDPFLLLDHFGPVDVAPGEAKGVPAHPHRGFETVTYLIDGRMRHRDSHGGSGLLASGDVQWMNAGAGVLHSEMPDESFLREGGRLQGVQLWVNLPAPLRLSPPCYQDVRAEEMPWIEGEGVQVKVIAGEAMGSRRAALSHLPIGYLHVRLGGGSRYSQALPEGDNALVYVLNGSVSVGDTELPTHAAALLRPGEPLVRLEAREPAEALLLYGPPVGEPVARYGPIVMNTLEEARQAMADFRAGRFGDLP
jgi:hypothetical protein